MLTWREVNRSFFKEAMRPPVMLLGETTQRLGRWDGSRRTIELSRSFVLEQPWSDVIEVLKHEMAHQFTHEVLGAVNESAHGPAFREVCGERGIDASASGLPSDRRVGGTNGQATPDPHSRLSKRVMDLLALAQSPNQHEAEAAAALAQRLMLKHNLELIDRAGRRHYGFRQLGTPNGRIQESEHLLAAILSDHFFIEAIWVPAYRPLDGKRGHVLEVAGTRENLDIASYVHGFMQKTAERLWKNHKKANGIRRNRDRRRFLSGVMEGFNKRLNGEKIRSEERGLVWVGDADLHAYYRSRHPHVRNVRLGSQTGSLARAQGRAAGEQIVLHRGMQKTASGSPPRALPPAKG
jgi:hypothetical protein